MSRRTGERVRSPRRGGAWATALIVLALCLLGCARRDGASPEAAPQSAATAPKVWYSETREMYHGIPVTLRFSPADEQLASQVWTYLEHVDDVFNIYRPDSEVARINQAVKPGRVEASRELAAAVQLSQHLHGLTGGAFDITVGPLVRVWREAAQTGKLPAQDALLSARAKVGLGKIRLENRDLYFDAPAMSFDFGGVVKGIAVDTVVAMLEEADRQAAFVQIGGETAAFGASVSDGPHRIGVQHPLDAGKLWTVIADPGPGVCAATSGNYRQPVVVGDQIFYHIVDPRTGRPADTHVLSATVVFTETGRNGLADGLSTACVVLGPEQSLALVARLGGEALVLVKAGSEIVEHKTAGWERLVSEAR